MVEMLASLLTILCCVAVGHLLPIVDPGLFVIMGVSSCREGSGYCLLGMDCTLDEDFLPDDQGGHCNGLRSAFTPSANFICCRYNAVNASSSVIMDNHLMDSIPAILLSMDTGSDNSTEMDYLTTETTTVEELPRNLLEGEPPSQVVVKRTGDPNSVGVLSVTGILSRLPFVTEVNLELLVHDNTTVQPPDQHRTSTVQTLDMSNSEFTMQQNMKQGKSMNMEDLITTETDVELQSTPARETELKDSQILAFGLKFSAEAASDVTEGPGKSESEDSTETNTVDSTVNMELETSSTTKLDLTTGESNSDVTPGQGRSQSEDSTETNNVPSSVNTDMETSTTDLDMATTEPIRENEISVEPDDIKDQSSTTAACGVTDVKNCWLVKFINDTNIMCVGSFLRNDIILTSANCVSRVFGVGLARLTLQTFRGTVIPRNLVRDVIVHEEYNKQSTDVALNDIGMVRLERALRLTPSMCTLCLPNSESDLLDKRCDRASRKYNTRNKMLDVSGSPMVCQGSTLGGVMSLYSPEPVYTPVSDYLPWIRHNMDIADIPLEWHR